MPLVPILVTLLVIGVLLWLVTLIPMDPTILQIIRVLVMIACVLWLLSVFGLIPGGTIRVGPG